MGDTKTQGLGVCLFLVGFVLLSAGFTLGGGMIILGLLGVAMVAGSCIVFAKAKAMSANE